MLTRPTLLRRLTTLVVGLGTALCLSAAALPHEHRHDTAAHNAANCHACRLQQAFTSTPPAAGAVPKPPAQVVAAVARPCDAPRAVLLLYLVSPRAPPLLS